LDNIITTNPGPLTGAQPCPGEGQMYAAKTGRGALRCRPGIYITATEMGILLFLRRDSQVPGVARRKPGKFFMGIYLPPGFGGMNLPLPRATREAFPSAHLNLVTAFLMEEGSWRAFPLWSLLSALCPLRYFFYWTPGMAKLCRMPPSTTISVPVV
jgi:hypothetical protein